MTKTLARAELLAGQQFAWSERTPLQRAMIDRAETALATALHAVDPAARVLREPDLLLTAQAVVIPDIAVFRGATWSGPDLVIEYRAESTDRLFYGPKRLAYARARVAEVWFVDATKETLTALRLTDALDYPWPATSFGRDDRVRSSSIDGLALTVRDFLQREETTCMQTANPLDALKIERGLLERQTAAGYVADSLRAAIQTGALSDGMELNQVALAEHFGISRVPVREALRALEGEGWITATPHRRAVVQAVSPERIQETFEIRALLETHLIEMVIVRIGDEQIAKLKKACDRMDQIADHQKWVAANADFHHELLESAGSPMALELVTQLSSQVERYLRLSGETVIRESEAGREHRDIVAAVAARDVDAARRLIRTHIEHTRGRVVDAISEEEKP